MKCRHCNTDLSLPLIDLGEMPPSNAYLTTTQQFAAEQHYPLQVWVCQHCWLVQTKDFTRAEQLFTEDYAYFSSTSSSWVEHAKHYADDVVNKLRLQDQSFVVELAANDGYLLQFFQQKGIPNLGVEPTAATANAARAKGIEILSEFFGYNCATQIKQRKRQADLIIANNVLAHVPDINDFAAGISYLLTDNGVVTVEFPHLLNLLKYNQFDTIYHEHYSYLSLIAVKAIFTAVGLRVFNVEHLHTHGGSLRVWADKAVRDVHENVSTVLNEELDYGLTSAKTYLDFSARALKISKALQDFIATVSQQGKTVLAYGAAAKGNTLLNFADITVGDIPAVFDAAVSKQGKYLPGSHIPILPPAAMAEFSPDYMLILPWNIQQEIIQQIKHQLPAQCQFVTAIPELNIVPAIK